MLSVWVKVATVLADEVAESVSLVVAGNRLPTLLLQYPSVPLAGGVVVKLLDPSVYTPLFMARLEKVTVLLADRVVNAPVLGVVAPMAVLLIPSLKLKPALAPLASKVTAPAEDTPVVK